MNIPKHVAIIMDGNRRWAKERGKKSLEGHRAGFINLKKLCVHILKKGVSCLSVFAFSTENFNRSQEEVDYLMDLFVRAFKEDFKEAEENEIKVIFSSERNLLRDDVRDAMSKIEDKTKNYTKGVLNICLGYGSRLEILEAAKRIAQKVNKGILSIDDIDENVFEENLYQQLLPIDLMIRTSGEQRISNFLLWQNAYAEFYFPDCYFPDFDNREFDKALEVFENRNRRFGGDQK